MLTFSCPWCDHELVVMDHSEGLAQVRCGDCATVVDLAPQPVHAPVDALPLAA
jgi:transcription elongation factor Elf1